MTVRRRIGIIGSGLAGLTLAQRLADCADVTIFEKSHGVGGRMATRWMDDVCYDHGAQYFTIRDDRFHDALEAARPGGVVEPWAGAVVSLGEDGLIERAGPRTIRYVGTPSMNALPTFLSKGIDVRFHAPVGAISGEPGRWFVTVRDSTEGPFDWVVATAPAPQTAKLLPARFSHHDRLGSVEMNACFTLMTTLSHAGRLPFAAAHVDDPVINWISLNNTKPDRPETPCLVVNSDAIWADVNVDKPLETIKQQMLEALRLYVEIEPGEAAAAVVHRWRHANVQRAVGEPYLLDRESRLAACGDWCIAGRVEAAFLSGARLGDALADIMEVCA